MVSIAKRLVFTVGFMVALSIAVAVGESLLQ
jgi:hypothetical protein